MTRIKMKMKKDKQYTKRISWSRGLEKSRQKKWRDSRSRETDGGEKIAVTIMYCDLCQN